MTALVGYIFSPGGFACLVLVCSLWLLARPGSRGARRLQLSVAAFYTCASIYLIAFNAGRLVATGDRPFTRSDVSSGATAIVVLGSGSFTARDWTGNRFSTVDPPAAIRVLEAVRVFKLIDQAWVISSGGLLDPDDTTNEPTGQAMRNALVQLGVPDTRVIVETKSRNTHEQAVILAPLLASMGIRQTVLVTSRLHMRRSLGAFKAAGINAVPAVAKSPYTNLSNVDWLLPSGLGLYEASLVAHEALGLLYYAARGWYHF